MPDASLDLRQLLSTVPIFAGLSGADLDALAERFTPVELAPGEHLMRRGEVGEFMCLLAAGELTVEVGGAVVDRLKPGAVVGEMALISVPERSADVAAGRGGAKVWRLARAEFERLAATHPSLLAAVHEVARPRLERAQLAPLLADRFGASTDAEVAQWQALARWRRLVRGEALYRRGEPASEVYLVVSGCLEVREASGERVRVAGRGAVVGESAVVGDGVRGHDVFAARETDVVALPAKVVGANPLFVSRLAADLLDGVVRAGVDGTVGARVALVCASEGAPVNALTAAVAERLRGWGRTLVLSSRAVDDRFGRAGVAQVSSDDPLAQALAMWLDEQLRAHEHVVLLADERTTPWTERCLRLVDVALLVADASAEPDAARLEPLGASPDLPWELALVHPDGTRLPSGTDRWLDALRPRAHHHVRLGEPRDLDRLARRLAGRAVGLALSGGGARGYAHIGLLQALAEREVPIDVVYGTSMGAVIGGAYALTQDVVAVRRLAERFGDRKRLMDMTLPLVALTRSRKVNETLRSLYGEEGRIEDLWVPFACVSASLTYAELRVHDRGPMWRAVRASAAIPGVFTPVLAEGGDVLVDGGVMNNLPADLLREHLGPGTVIASNAYGGRADAERMSFGDDVSGWAVLRSKVLPIGRKVRAPSLLGTLMRATSLASKRLLDEAARYADLVVTYPSSTVRSLEFDQHEETIASGYRHATEAVAEWLSRPGAASWLPAEEPAEPTASAA